MNQQIHNYQKKYYKNSYKKKQSKKLCNGKIGIPFKNTSK